jgi:hypothetical protein
VRGGVFAACVRNCVSGAWELIEGAGQLFHANVQRWEALVGKECLV